MSYTTNPDDPRLTRGVDAQPVGQAPVYLVLSEEERNKGFVRPYRDEYKHVGIRPQHPLRDLTDEEKVVCEGSNYVKYEVYPEDMRPRVGKFWTQVELDSGCGGVTSMSRPLSETYARDPGFYGATYCVSCARHLPVAEFVWTLDGERVGS